MVLRGEDVARSPADVGTKGDEGLDEHGRLHRHVKRAGDAGALERLTRAELGTHGHEAGHLVLGEADFVAAEGSEGKVSDLVIVGGGIGHG